LAGLVATPTAPKLTDLLSDMKAATGGKPPVVVPPKTEFVAWECMRWNNAPESLAGCGLRRMPIYYQDSMLTGEEPDFPKIDKVIASIKANRQSFVTLDIERWNPSSTAEREKLIRVVEYVRERVPAATELALYGIMPKPRYADYLKGGERLAYQQRENRLAQPLANRVDWIQPVFHAYSTNRRDWLTYATVIMSEARTYGKPVMPWLWPQYHEDSKDPSIRYQLIPGDAFREQLETAYRLGDSLCLRGTLQPRPNGTIGRATWNGQAPWWAQTKAFLQSHGQSLAACQA
jgi:hypothetical protein